MNNVVLIGRLTKDPEIRYTQTQTAVCSFTLAVDRPVRKDQNSNTPTADFIRITCFGRQAENCNKYLAKGRQTAVSGRIQTGSYTDKDGRKIYTTDVVAERVEFIGNRSNAAPAPQQTAYVADAPAYQSAAYVAPNQTPGAYQQRIDDEIPSGFAMLDEDEVPF